MGAQTDRIWNRKDQISCHLCCSHCHYTFRSESQATFACSANVGLCSCFYDFLFYIAFVCPVCLFACYEVMLLSSCLVMSCQAQRLETLQQEHQPETVTVTGTVKVTSLIIY